MQIKNLLHLIFRYLLLLHTREKQNMKYLQIDLGLQKISNRETYTFSQKIKKNCKFIKVSFCRCSFSYRIKFFSNILKAL